LTFPSLRVRLTFSFAAPDDPDLCNLHAPVHLSGEPATLLQVQFRNRYSSSIPSIVQAPPGWVSRRSIKTPSQATSKQSEDDDITASSADVQVENVNSGDERDGLAEPDDSTEIPIEQPPGNIGNIGQTGTPSVSILRRPGTAPRLLLLPRFVFQMLMQVPFGLLPMFLAPVLSRTTLRLILLGINLVMTGSTMFLSVKISFFTSALVIRTLKEQHGLSSPSICMKLICKSIPALRPSFHGMLFVHVSSLNN
jgi:hypothetical protein